MLGQGTKKPEAGHQANEATVFYKKGYRLAYINIRWLIFKFENENLYTLKNDDMNFKKSV
jgi:hypothetical protein